MAGARSKFNMELERDYGVIWPSEIPDTFVKLLIAKKWKEFRARDKIQYHEPWKFLLSAARDLLTPAQFKISEWTEEHFHDFTLYDKLVTIGCASSSKSNDFALLLILDWMTDPLDTVTLLGSTTKTDLASRSWDSVLKYHQCLRMNPHGFTIPGKVSKVGYKLVNVDDDDTAGSATEKAGIQGRALNEDGRLQGAHARYVRLVVDELAEIGNHEGIKTAIANLRVGTVNFKFIGLANPESWENPSSVNYCMPETGVDSVNVDTGSWMSTFGAFVRHHDGLKSPIVKDPSKTAEFPFLMSQEQIDETIREEQGNTDAPRIWKMIRGFPQPRSASVPVILDPDVLVSRKCLDRPDASAGDATVLFRAAGIDPAWSEGGDGAVYQGVDVLSIGGFPILDFRGVTDHLQIKASLIKDKSITQQLREQVIQFLRAPDAPTIEMVAIDSSGNQGLADDMDNYVGQGCLHVNNSERASANPIRMNDNRETKDHIYDRGTESWCVLAEFCRAGMVRGLPDEAAKALISRRFAYRAGSLTISTPLRMEKKEDFKKRFRKSPDVADACALAALIVKERGGIFPFMNHLPKNILPAQQQPFEQMPDGFDVGVTIGDCQSGYGASTEFGEGAYSQPPM